MLQVSWLLITSARAFAGARCPEAPRSRCVTRCSVTNGDRASRVDRWTRRSHDPDALRDRHERRTALAPPYQRSMVHARCLGQMNNAVREQQGTGATQTHCKSSIVVGHRASHDLPFGSCPAPRQEESKGPHERDEQHSDDEWDSMGIRFHRVSRLGLGQFGRRVRFLPAPLPA